MLEVGMNARPEKAAPKQDNKDTQGDSSAAVNQQKSQESPNLEVLGILPAGKGHKKPKGTPPSKVDPVVP